jgi:hypothetical protein
MDNDIGMTEDEVSALPSWTKPKDRAGHGRSLGGFEEIKARCAVCIADPAWQYDIVQGQSTMSSRTMRRCARMLGS